jgi:hypothetical protein
METESGWDRKRADVPDGGFNQHTRGRSTPSVSRWDSLSVCFIDPAKRLGVLPRAGISYISKSRTGRTFVNPGFIFRLQQSSFIIFPLECTLLRHRDAVNTWRMYPFTG